MRKIKNAVVTFVITYMIFANCIVSYAAEEGEQRYYLLYMYDQENGASVEIGINQVITDQANKEINMDNLILFPIEGGVYHPFQMEQLGEEELTREIREYLLYAGYAQIDDETTAEDYELEAQEHAKLNGLGGWKESADEQEYEQNSSGVQKGEDGGQIDGNTENDNDTEQATEKATDANANDGAGDEDANFFAKLFDKTILYIEGWSMPVKIFWIVIICLLILIIRKFIVRAVRNVRAKKSEEEKALRRKNRYSNRY